LSFKGDFVEKCPDVDTNLEYAFTYQNLHFFEFGNFGYSAFNEDTKE
jgi:hypothetical protein